MANRPRDLNRYESPRHYFGAELRLLREQAELSQDKLGRLVNYSGDQIAAIEKAQRWPTAALAQELDTALDTGGALSRLLPLLEQQRSFTPYQQPASASAQEPETMMNRREWLRHTSTLTAAALPQADALETNSPRTGPSHSVGAALQNALVTSATAATADGPAPLSHLSQLRGQVADLWAARQGSRYRALATMLPPLLADAHGASNALPAPRREEAAALLALAYQCAAGALAKIGESHSAWIAAERAVASARDAGQPLVLATSIRMLAVAFLSMGRYQEAEQLTRAACGELDAGPPAEDLTTLSVYGASLLTAAVAAAHQGKANTAQHYLGEADVLAARLGNDHNHLWTAFGPANAGIHRVSVEVLLGEGGRAVEHGVVIDLTAVPSLERRAHHLIDLAVGCVQWSKDREAAEFLLRADALAPEEVRHQPASQRLIRGLLQRGTVDAGGPIRMLLPELAGEL